MRFCFIDWVGGDTRLTSSANFFFFKHEFEGEKNLIIGLVFLPRFARRFQMLLLSSQPGEVR